MSESVLDQFRSDLAGRRAELVAEGERLGREAEQAIRRMKEVERVLQGIEQLLHPGQHAPTAGVLTKPVAPATSPEIQEALGKLIVQCLKEAGPAGMTSVELLAMMESRWPHGGLSARRIGTKAARLVEVTSDGARWYYVPAEADQDA